METLTGFPNPPATESCGLSPPVSHAIHLVDPQARVIDYLRVSVTDRCNYRCTYCMPSGGVAHADRQDVLSFEEIRDLVRCFARLGVSRVRLTGGEPTVRRDLVDLVRMLRHIEGIREIALSTNGHLLRELAAPLRDAGVDRLNVSIDSLDAARFAEITRGGDLARVLDGVEAARAAGFASIKINTVAVKGFNDGEIGDLCAYAWKSGMVPRFIEQMPMAGGELYVPGGLLTAAEIRAAVERANPGKELLPDTGGKARGAGPARYFRLSGTGHLLGIISAMTDHFCATCNRVRLSSSGHLHTCLAYDDAVDLRSALRTGGPDAVVSTIRHAVAGKRDGHVFQLIGLGGPRKAMVQIGG